VDGRRSRVSLGCKASLPVSSEEDRVPALKDSVDQAMVADLAAEFAAADPSFSVRPFVIQACDGLDRLELKDRVRQVAAALEDALPDDPHRVVAILDAALDSATFNGWMVWPCTELMGRLGPDAPEVVVPFLARLTTRSSCEFAIRPCIEAHPELTFAALERWVDHEDEQVRRLVSEGSRPRLPWGLRLRALQEDPRPTIALLDRLRDDPSEVVRRSVANHLGDVAKDHPDLAIATARRWRDEGGDHVGEVIRHGLRTLIKAGDPDALQLIGYDRAAPVELTTASIVPDRLPIGGVATIRVQLVATGDTAVPVVVEYLVHYLGARGPRKPKAYRLAERVLEPGERCDLKRRHTFDHASIRTLHPGEHRVEIQVNGRILGACAFELTP
jgi:3-methyladenine DNA glycosylase AlkC